MFAIKFLAASLTLVLVEAVHFSNLLDAQKPLAPAAPLTAPPRATAGLALPQDGITADPKELRRRQETVTSITVYPGPYSWLTTLGSLCGFMASNIYFAIYCDEGQYCFTTGQLLQCCSTTSDSSWISTGYYTETSTGRNTLTTTFVSTQLLSESDTYGSICTAAPQTCYNYNDTASCTGSCTSTALVCTDQYFPYCASLYSGGYSPSAVGTTSTYLPAQFGISYFCDTEAYGLEFGEYGYWPSVTSTSVYSTATGPSTTPTFTPNVVPYSRTQASRPSQAMLLGPTSTTSAAAASSRKITPAAEILATMSLLLFFYLRS